MFNLDCAAVDVVCLCRGEIKQIDHDALNSLTNFVLRVEKKSPDVFILTYCFLWSVSA